MGQRIIISEEDRKHIRGLYEQPTSTPEDNEPFLEWAENAEITPFIAPNPYSGGDLKLGVQIKSSTGEDLSKISQTANQKTIINLIERMDIITENGQVVHTFTTEEQDGSGSGLFNFSTFKPTYEIIDNSFVVYTTISENSEVIQKLKQFTNKTNKFIVTVTPRLSNDLLKTGSKLFKTKSNILMVN